MYKGERNDNKVGRNDCSYRDESFGFNINDASIK